MGCGPRSVARESHEDARGAGLPISLNGWISCGAGVLEIAARLSELFSSVSENGHFLSDSLSYSLWPQRQPGLDHTSIRTSEEIQSNGRQLGKAEAGRERHPSRTRRTTEWLRGKEALRNSRVLWTS